MEIDFDPLIHTTFGVDKEPWDDVLNIIPPSRGSAESFDYSVVLSDTEAQAFHAAFVTFMYWQELITHRMTSNTDEPPF